MNKSALRSSVLNLTALNLTELNLAKRARLIFIYILALSLTACILDGDVPQNKNSNNSDNNSGNGSGGFDELKTNLHQLTLPNKNLITGQNVPDTSGTQFTIPLQSLSFNDDTTDFSFSPLVNRWQESSLNWSDPVASSNQGSNTAITRQFVRFDNGKWSTPYTTTNAKTYKTNPDPDNIDRIFETYMGVTIEWEIADEGGTDKNNDGLIADRDGVDLSGDDIKTWVPTWSYWTDPADANTAPDNNDEFSEKTSSSGPLLFSVNQFVLEQQFVIEDTLVVTEGVLTSRFSPLVELKTPQPITSYINLTPAEKLLIESNLAQITKTDTKIEEVVINRFGLGSYFGLNIFISDSPISVAIIATSDLKPVSISLHGELTESGLTYQLIDIDTNLLPNNTGNLRTLLNLPPWVESFYAKTTIDDGDPNTEDQAANYFGKKYVADKNTKRIQTQFFNDIAAEDVKKAFRAWRVKVDEEKDK